MLHRYTPEQKLQCFIDRCDYKGMDVKGIVNTEGQNGEQLLIILLKDKQTGEEHAPVITSSKFNEDEFWDYVDQTRAYYNKPFVRSLWSKIIVALKKALKI